MNVRNLFYLVSISLIGSGCVLDKPLIHPKYHELEPREIVILPVENRTLLDLSDVVTAGLLQKMTFGGRGVDVPMVFQRALFDGLERKGYQIRLGEPPTDADGVRPPVVPHEGGGNEAFLYCSLTRWKQAAVTSGGDIEISGTVELLRARDPSGGGGEVLFKKDFHHRTSFSSRGVRTPADLEHEVRRAALNGIRQVPPFKTEPSSMPLP